MISSNAKYWIWITLALGYKNPKVKRIYELYTDISLFYLGGKKEWMFCGILTEKDVDRLSKYKIHDTQKIIDRCNELGYSILSIDDEKYPDCLRNIYDPPAVIYINGNVGVLDNRLRIGIVGTRRATSYGLTNSYRIGYSLSKYGVATVSGGALGVDCASHRGSLAADGVTICVRGCGINSKYLAENAKMREAITMRGAVISEYPPDVEPKNYYFPARNRIIAALSNGVLIIESGERSGSLITANLAVEQGKEVFALMGNNSPQNKGSNQRIKEGSALPVTDFMDILNAFDNLYVTGENVDLDNISIDDIEAIPVKGKPINKNKKQINNNINNQVQVKEQQKEIKHKENLDLNPTTQSVYNAISNEPIHIDDLTRKLQVPVYVVLRSITELEIKGLIKALQGRRYILN